jgi:hypothetical protein
MKLFKLLRRLFVSLIHAAQATRRPPWRRCGHVNQQPVEM